MSTPLPGWSVGPFTHDGLTRPVYTRGSGPCVVVIHEIPGITPKVLRFAEEVVDAGFSVAMPSLLGEPGAPLTGPYAVRSILRMCVASEFTTWAVGRTSPIIAWLRALAAQEHARCGGPGVGALGMCFSGGFALGMMLDDRLIAPVLSQPSLPLSFVSKAHAADLNLSPEDLARVKARVAAGCPVLGLRYDQDSAVGTRFDTLRRELGDGFLAVELPSSKAGDHSVLTEQRHDPTVTRVLDFFRERLRPVQA
jgi:dienelactone hydrolase